MRERERSKGGKGDEVTIYYIAKKRAMTSVREKRVREREIEKTKTKI